MQPDTIILGAGMAGLAAARTLAEAGQEVLILESSNRIGGRILTQRSGPHIIELGAEFIHGRPPELLALIEEAGLTTYERNGTVLNAQLQEEDDEDFEDPLETLRNYRGPDRSFTDYIATQNLPADLAAESIRYVEGFNAADATRASIHALAYQQKAEDAIEGDRVARIIEGYDRLPQYLWQQAERAGAHLLLNTPVTDIRWQENEVTLNGTHTARRAIVTVPLPILQSLPTTPAIPLPGLEMGQVLRFTLVLKEPLWPAEMSFLITPHLVYWTAHPHDPNTITGWLGGPRATQLTQAEALDATAKALALSPDALKQNLVSFHTHDWQADPHTRGSYSWVPVGALPVPSNSFAGTLYLAGEHTDTTGHWGTVHAAYRSGLRAAQQILRP